MRFAIIGFALCAVSAAAPLADDLQSQNEKRDLTTTAQKIEAILGELSHILTPSTKRAILVNIATLNVPQTMDSIDNIIHPYASTIVKRGFLSNVGDWFKDLGHDIVDVAEKIIHADVTILKSLVGQATIDDALKDVGAVVTGVLGHDIVDVAKDIGHADGTILKLLVGQATRDDVLTDVGAVVTDVGAAVTGVLGHDIVDVVKDIGHADGTILKLLVGQATRDDVRTDVGAVLTDVGAAVTGVLGHDIVDVAKDIGHADGTILKLLVGQSTIDDALTDAGAAVTGVLDIITKHRDEIGYALDLAKFLEGAMGKRDLITTAQKIEAILGELSHILTPTT